MTPRVKSAIVFGKGRVAVKATELLLSEGYDIRFVVPSSSELAGDIRFSDWAVERGLELRTLEKLDQLPTSPTDLGISTYFDRIFRQRHIDRFGILANVHNSLLPKNRGVRPINWALKNNERTHGVSLHAITPGIDEGAVFDQEEFAIDPPFDEVRDVYARCLDAAEVLLARSLPRIWDLTPTPQDESLASYHDSSADTALGDRRFWTRNDTRLE